MLLYLIDLAGVAVFAVSGALAAARKGLDLLGIVVIATVTAIGTTRDLLLDRHPVSWVEDTRYLIVIAAAAVLTVIIGRWRVPHPKALEIADALGLGFFVIGGAGIALDMGLPTISVIVMGVMTGVAGGVIRDVLTNEIPLILAQGELYATAAIAGAAVYVALTSLGVPEPGPAFAGATVTIALRLSAIVWRLRLPVFRLRE